MNIQEEFENKKARVLAVESIRQSMSNHRHISFSKSRKGWIVEVQAMREGILLATKIQIRLK